MYENNPSMEKYENMAKIQNWMTLPWILQVVIDPDARKNSVSEGRAQVPTKKHILTNTVRLEEKILNFLDYNAFQRRPS